MYIQLDDLTMYYTDNKQVDRPALFFVHGLGESLDSWQNQLAVFGQDYRVIAMDLRGHHRSTEGDKPISIKQFADDIIKLSDALGIEQAHYVGLSMGGIICQQLALDYPQRMLSVVLSNTAAYAGEEGRAKLHDRLAMIEAVSMDEMADFIVRACLPEPVNPAIYQAAFAIFRLNRKQPYMAATTATFSIDYRQQLAKINLPTLVFTGELDKATPPAASQFIHEQIKGSQLHILAGVGHLSKLEQPQEFNRLIQNFLATTGNTRACPA